MPKHLYPVLCVCVFTFVYFFSRHSLHQCCRETWMSAGLTDREMGECRRGRMDGGERDEYWLISRKIDRQRIIAAFRLSLFFFFFFFFPSLTFPAHLFLPSYATKTALEFLKWFYYVICRILVCLYPRVIYWNPLCLFVWLDKPEQNTFWCMKTVWNLITFSLHNEIPLQWVSVHIFDYFRMHYLSVIHCLAIILLVFPPPAGFCRNSLPLAKPRLLFSWRPGLK